MTLRRARTLLVAALVGAFSLAGCAPALRVLPQSSALAARYAQGRTARAARMQDYGAALLVRIDGRATGKLPGLTADLALAAPDRARVRLSWLLGTALDVCAGGDSLLARALGATWEPPAASWAAAARDTAGAPLRWSEQGDSLALTLSADGLPAEVRIARGEGAVRVRYTDWERWDGLSWPHRLELADERGWVRLRLEMTEPRHVRADDARLFTLTLPRDAQRIDWHALRTLLGLDEEDR